MKNKYGVLYRINIILNELISAIAISIISNLRVIIKIKKWYKFRMLPAKNIRSSDHNEELAWTKL